jgi:uncharacterized membrane protein
MPLIMDDSERQRLVEAIAAAERGNRGELRLHIEERCEGDALTRARHIFGALKMHETKDDTGVLLYISPTSQKVSIYAGDGVHKAAGETLWSDAVARVAAGFRKDEGVTGIVDALELIGEAMRQCAPGEDTAGNELPDEVTFS